MELYWQTSQVMERVLDRLGFRKKLQLAHMNETLKTIVYDWFRRKQRNLVLLCRPNRRNMLKLRPSITILLPDRKEESGNPQKTNEELIVNLLRLFPNLESLTIPELTSELIHNWRQ